ncbi:MAG: winged helix-turn-helix transcriptional regulator [Kiritimatiellae bacterium]|nr:winged helix-turn-helix transcriptional regulator [Kiritimatiellia bacterium]
MRGVGPCRFCGRWKAGALYRLCAEVVGFREHQRHLPGVARARLSSAFGELECEGVVRFRELLDGRVRRTEYPIAEKGRLPAPCCCPPPCVVRVNQNKKCVPPLVSLGETHFSSGGGRVLENRGAGEKESWF